MSAFASLLTQALQLPHDERAELAMQLLRSLEPDNEGELTTDEWEAAWSAEIDRRVREVDDGRVELLDGDEVHAAVRAWLDARPTRLEARRSGLALQARGAETRSRIASAARFATIACTE